MNFSSSELKKSSSMEKIAFSEVSDSTDKEVNITDEIILEMQKYSKNCPISTPLTNPPDLDTDNILLEYQNMHDSMKNFTTNSNSSLHSKNSYGNISQKNILTREEEEEFLSNLDNYYQNYNKMSDKENMFDSFPRKKKIEKLSLKDRDKAIHDFYSNFKFDAEEESDNAILNEYVTTYVIEEVEEEDEISQLREVFVDYVEEKIFFKNILEALRSSKTVYQRNKVMKLQREKMILCKERMTLVLRGIMEVKRVKSLGLAFRLIQRNFHENLKMSYVKEEESNEKSVSLNQTLKKELDSIKKNRNSHKRRNTQEIDTQPFALSSTPHRLKSKTKSVTHFSTKKNQKNSHDRINSSIQGHDATPCFKLVLKNENNANYDNLNREGLKSHRHPINRITNREKMNTERSSLMPKYLRGEEERIFSTENYHRRMNNIHRKKVSQRLLTDNSNSDIENRSRNKKKSMSRNKSYGCESAVSRLSKRGKGAAQEYCKHIREKSEIFRRNSSKKINDILRPKKHFMSNLNNSYRYRSQKSFRNASGKKKKVQSRNQNNRRKSKGGVNRKKKRKVSYFDLQSQKNDARFTLNFDNIKDDKTEQSSRGFRTERYSKKPIGVMKKKNVKKFLETSLNHNKKVVDNFKEKFKRNINPKVIRKKRRKTKGSLNRTEIIKLKSRKASTGIRKTKRINKNNEDVLFQGKFENSHSSVTEEEFKMSIPGNDVELGDDQNSSLKKGKVINPKLLRKFKMSLKSMYGGKEVAPARGKRRHLF